MFESIPVNMRSKVKITFTIWLLCLFSLSKLVEGQCVITNINGDSIKIEGIDTLSIRFNVNSTNPTLGQSFQGLCGVRLAFEHSNLSDLEIRLTSPDGDEVILIGPAIGNGTQSSMPFLIEHNVWFRPQPTPIDPHPHLSGTWSNISNDWGNVSFYDGTYYPFFGDLLASLQGGSVNGIWELTIIDPFLNDAGLFQEIELDFCDRFNTFCSPCESDAGHFDLTGLDTFQTCLGLDASLTDNYLQGLSDDEIYTLEFFIFDENDSLILAGEDPDLSALPIGRYIVHAFDIDSIQFEGARSGIYNLSRGELIDSVDQAGGVLCMDLSNSLPLKINDVPAVTVDVDANPPNLNCGQDSATLTHRWILPSQSVEWFKDGTALSEFENNTEIRVGDEGIYRVVITNDIGCEIEGEYVLSTDFSIPQAEVRVSDITCDSIEVVARYVTPDGILGQTWINIDDNMAIGTGPDVVISNSGSYRLDLIGENECDTSIIFEVRSNLADIAISNFPTGDTSITCSSTSIDLAPVRDDALLREEFWLRGASDTVSFSQNLTVTSGGMYRYIVIAENGCINGESDVLNVVMDTSTQEYTITYDSLTCATSMATVSLSGLENVNTIWSADGLVSSNDTTAVIDTEGMVRFQINDIENGCSQEDSVFIRSNEDIPQVIFPSDTMLSCFSPQVPLSPSILSVVDSVLWLDPLGQTFAQSSIVASDTGMYLFTAIGLNGCEYVDSLMVSDNSERPNVTLPETIEISCADATTELSIAMTTDIFRVDWILGQDTFSGFSLDREPVVSSILVQIVGDNGCEASERININFDTLPPAFLLIPDTIDCNKDTIDIFPDRPLMNHTFQWIGGEIDGLTNERVRVGATGAYGLVVVDTLNGCSNVEVVDIESNFAEPTFSILPLDTITCNGPATVSLDTENENEVTWFSNDGRIIEAPTFIANQAGFQRFMVVGANGCCATDSVEVFDDLISPRVEVENSYELSCINAEFTITPSFFDEPTTVLWRFEGNVVTTNRTELINDRNILESLVVIGQNGCDTTVDFSISVANDIPPADILEEDTTICSGESLLLTSPSLVSMNHIPSWLLDGLVIGGSDITLTADVTGQYILNVQDTSSGCESFDTVNIIINPSPLQSLIVDASGPECFGDNQGFIHVTGVNGGEGNLTVFLDNVDVGFIPNEPLSGGSYSLLVRDELSCELDTTIILSDGDNIDVNLGADLEVERGEVVQVIPELEGDAPVSAIWIYNGDTIDTNIDLLESAFFEDGVLIYIATTGNGCIAEDSINIDVFVDLSKIEVYVPNIINPLSTDANNEVVLELPPDIVQVNDFNIYDRWGQQVVHIDRIQQGEIRVIWDGTFNGQSVTSGVYVFTYEMLTIYSSEVRQISGDITVIR